ncbi:sensor histidine kinase [Rhizobium sp. BK251]|uniref:sensor histidine kinase n=1 Tax=Rhizobium sp. BK251 TaxID=2512125 RepID=UPI0010E731CD|nr:sensor histidine kinase [Rhizobium sp. BK251]TCL76137.1 two component regulator with propeller domain [Rhizobium sp. BK251]
MPSDRVSEPRIEGWRGVLPDLPSTVRALSGGAKALLRTAFCAVLLVIPVMLSSPTMAQEKPAVIVAAVDPEIVDIPVQDGNDIRFRKLSLSQGLSQTRVSHIVQDNDGYLWFGTQHGVNRYDGYGFRVFKHEQGQPDSLSGIFIYSLFKDRSGTIWVGSDQFLDAFDKATETFRHYSFDPANPTVIHISEDRQGNLWLSTGRGLYRLDPKSGKAVRFGHDPKDPASLSSDDVKSSGEDREGTFWVATSAGLEAFDRATGKVTRRITLREEVREFSFHEDRHGTFWVIYGSGNGLAVYDRKENKLIRYAFAGQDGGKSLTGVYAILEASDGNIWLATMGAGLLRFDRDNMRFIRYKNDPNDPQSLSENRVIALFEDAEGNIWTGLHATPPNSFPTDAAPFRTLWPSPGHVDKLGEALVNTIYEDRSGAIWLGAGGALNRLDPQTRTVEVFTPAGPNASIEVLAIAEDSNGTLWIGSLGGGLYAFDPATRQFKAYRYDAANPQGISSDIVTRILVDRSGELWLATWNGINRFDPATGDFTTYKQDPSASAEAYFSIVEDENGRFWLGTTAGLVSFNPRDATFTAYKHDANDPQSLSNNVVNSVYAPGGGVIWLGTQNGLNRLNVESGKFDVFYERDGLAGNAVSCLLGGNDGQLWMSTNRGISRMNVNQRSFDSYTTADGLPGNDLTGWNACNSGRSGKMYFGGFAGATVNNAGALGHDEFVPPVVFTDLQVGTPPNAVPPKFTHASGDQPAAVTVPYDERDMTVSFSALSYRSPETTRYRYKLMGYDSEWHAATSDQRTISYAALPAGSFTLRVQAATTRGNWNMPGASMQIVVLPPWWQSWWARLTVIGILLAGLVSLYRYRVAKVAAQYNILLQERISERNRLARDLHDTLLQSFQGLIYRLQAVRHSLPHQPAAAAAMLDVVLDKSDEAIIEGRNAVQALRDSTHADFDIVAAVRSEADELAKLNPGNAASFKLDVHGQPFDLDPKVRDDVYRIVLEALRNAFRHAGASSIDCEFIFTDTDLRIQVQDNGSGIRTGAGEDGASGKRWGLAGMKERAEKIGAHLLIESHSGKGTKIELVVKGSRGGWGRNLRA